MKFGKVLKVSSEHMPDEMHDLFLRYKELKKKIKAIPAGKDAPGHERQASVSLNVSHTGSGSSGAVINATGLSAEEQAFITTLNEDLDRFNRYFIEKEEEAVIRLQALCDELMAAATAAGLPIPAELTAAAAAHSDPEVADAAAAPPAAAGEQQQAAAPRPPATNVLDPVPSGGGGDPAEPQPAQAGDPPSHPQQQQPQQQQQQQQRMPAHGHGHGHHGASSAHKAAMDAVKSRLVQLHGELVLLLHWSLLNYAAVVKILKKHDKRTGVLLRAPYLANVLSQPFSSTTIMSHLAKRAAELVVVATHLAPVGPAAPRLTHPPRQPPGATAGGAHAHAAAGGESSGGTATVVGTPQGGRGGAPGGAAGGGGGGGGPSASGASTLTCAGGADREAHTEPLVGRTMHALETWANLRKNAITPSTVLLADVDQPRKRKATAEAGADAGDTQAAAPGAAARGEGAAGQ